MIDISKALEIPGWMSAQELTWLAEQAQTHRAIVEIGSYLGRSTRVLGDHTPGRVVAIDDWKGPRDIECDKTNLLKKFFSNVKDLIGADKVLYLKRDHGDFPLDILAYAKLVDMVDYQGIDMVFIDGDHEYENVKRDIIFWKNTIAPYGVLCGHDFHYCSGVRQAVEELLPSYSLVPGTDIWRVQNA